MTYEYDFVDGWLIRDRADYIPVDEVSKATIFALANGYMSSRGAPENVSPLLPSVVGHYINGIYDSPTDSILDREMINLPAWTVMALQADGQFLDLECDALQKYTRTLDMKRGVLEQNIKWRLSNGTNIRLVSERLVSMEKQHLAGIHWQLSADADCDIVLSSALDAAVNNRFADTHFGDVTVNDNAISITTIQEKHQAMVMMRHTVDIPDYTAKQAKHSMKCEEHYHFSLKTGQLATIDKFIVVYDSRFSDGDLEQLCSQEIDDAHERGYDEIRDAHIQALDSLWADSDVVIDGDEQAQIAIRFCIFHLLANLPHSELVSVSARGLQGQDYWGSIFWDCDIYVLPFMTYTQPDYARNSLLYRYHTLDGARRKAQGLDYQGAYYAWQSQETGDETCALYVFDDPFTGEKIRSYFADEQIHISADVVYALWQYVQVTGDRQFLIEQGLEIICEVARFFASRAVYHAEREVYELKTVLGPDEYHERVDNNAYTNILAKDCLNIALATLEKIRTEDDVVYSQLSEKISLDGGEIETWRTVADGLYAPEPDPETGLIAQFDGYFDLEDTPPDIVGSRLKHPDQHPGGPLGPYQATQAIKQADVVLLTYLFRERYSKQNKQANWNYYESRTAHDSSLSPMAYALVAADVGMTDWAYRYFLHTAMIDLLGTGPHWNLGVHTAALGGAWITVVHGFCQLNLDDDGVHFNEWPLLPAHWEQVSFKFYWQGHLVDFNTDGKTITLQSNSGDVPVFCPDGKLVLRSDQPLQLQITKNRKGE
jgi:nigerose phosphorylase